MPHSKKMPSEPPVPDRDLIKRMKVYQIAAALMELAWEDAQIALYHPITKDSASQLFTAVASIAANLAEGYSRSSGRDRARIFEYALGSARESSVWYEAVGRVLPNGTLDDRSEKLEEVKRILLAVIPRERSRLIRPAKDSNA
jgi:four helix bundle protein